MMANKPLIVIADDLTGAAEVAAIAHGQGFHARVVTRLSTATPDADVLVFATDSRLAKPAVAARRVRAATLSLRAIPNAGFFKKTDSVLRGPVLAELTACAAALGRRRILLIAGNPSLGRVVRGGKLWVGRQPLHRTAFARDPHHPAMTAEVRSLLGSTSDDPVARQSPGQSLPPRGVIIGEHRSARDTQRWALAVHAQTLPAGSADFFRAWLGTKKLPARGPVESAAIGELALLLHGTTVPPALARVIPFNGLRAPSVVRVAAALRHRHGAAVAATALTLADPLAPPRIAENFAALARALRDAGAFRHLLIAGGATAASVLRALGWSRLEVVRVWAPGVVSLQPVGRPEFTVTVKPGSYPWPANLRQFLPAIFS